MKRCTGEANGLSYSVAVPGGRQTIVEIDELTIRPGELTILAGPSGSGKSTLLYLLAGLLVPTSGSVRWNDTVLSSRNESERDRWRLLNAGFVFQSFNLVEEMSPLGNVLLPTHFGYGSTASCRARATELLHRFEVPDRPGRVSLLSRGEQQRLALSRALVLDPKIIFADEPTASLDARSGRFVIDALASLAAEGRVVVVAAHDPNLIERAGHLVSLEQGRIGPRAAAA